MALEMAFDPSSRFLAVGTSNCHVQIFDVAKGFQTHEFRQGSFGIVTKLAFCPQEGSLQLVSATEDLSVKVYDMMLNSEVATIKAVTSRVSDIVFSADFKVMMVAARDGSVTLFNAFKKFELLD